MKKILEGTIAMKGIAEGAVYLIKNPAEMPEIKNGIILVAPFTTPILAPIISSALGIITDIGGLTGHAAIISREFGIPCIVGTKNATKLLRNGQKILLDATTGEVYEL